MIQKMRSMATCLFLGCLLAAPGWADTQFRARRMTRDDVPPGKGQCDIRLQVDNEVEVSVRGDMVMIHTLAGRDARDDGSDCNAPMPDRNLQGFGFEVKDSRGDVRMVSEPSPRNGFSAVVRIRDSAGGDGRYHFRLSWQLAGAGGGGGGGFREGGERRPEGRGRGGWNEMVNYRGRGRGVYTRRGDPPRNIYEVNVTVDREGRVVAVFNAEGGAPLSFTGNVSNWQAGTLTADLVAGDQTRGLRGAALISLDERRQVDRVNMDGTADRDRFHLEWSRGRR